MGISVEQYRIAIGLFAGGGREGKNRQDNDTDNDTIYTDKPPPSSFINIFEILILFIYIAIIYLFTGLMLLYKPSCIPKMVPANLEAHGMQWPIMYQWYAHCVFMLFLDRKRYFSTHIINYCAVCVEKLINCVFYICSLAKSLIARTQPNIMNPGPGETPNKINIVYCNVNGLIHMQSMRGDQPQFQISKIKELRGYLSTYLPDIVLVNETWLNKHVQDGEVFSDKYYSMFRKDRTKSDMEKYGKSGGGGVMILTKNTIGVEVQQINTKTELPIVSILLKPSHSAPICLSTLYRYDYSGLDFFKDVETYYTGLMKKYKNVTILGDLNLNTVRDWDLPVSSSSIHEEYIHLFNTLGIKSLVNEPTHKDGGILDLLLTSSEHLFSNVSVIEGGLLKSDHFTIQCQLAIKKVRPKYNVTKKFAFKRANWEALDEELLAENWLQRFGDLSAEKCWQVFKSRLDIILRKHVPLVSVKLGSQPPWYDDELRSLKKDLDKARAAAIRHPEDQMLVQYHKEIEEGYRNESLQKERSYYDMTSINENSSSAEVSKKFFKHVKSQKSSTRIPDTVYYRESFRTKALEKADLFNEFFSDQFTEPSGYQVHVDMLRNHENDFNSEMFYVDEVKCILRKLDPSKATGPDNIPGILLKKCCRSVAYPLTLIFNKSYKDGYLPCEWKNANVVPIHKKGDKANVENYRPISLTCLCMKVLEKLVRERLYRICLPKVTPFQHGFVPFKSCSTQLIEFNSDLALNLNRGLQTDIIFFDFKKAFDSVSHDVILKKLKINYNIDGRMLQFLKTYLSGRKQRVALDGKHSDWAMVRSGVPQGSILGPFLFVLFINDIVNEVREGTQIRLYADDLKIWKVINCTSDSLQPDIDNLLIWSENNKISFHPDKCKLLRCTLKRNQVPLTYNLGSSEIVLCQSETDLGVTTTNKLSSTEHQIKLLSKSSQRLGLVKRTCAGVVQSQLKRKTLFVSLVRSLYEHCSQVWRPLSETSIDKFEKMQKRAVKWIFNESECSYDMTTYLTKLRDLDILPLSAKFNYNDLKMFHKIFYRLLPLHFPSFLHPFDPTVDNDRPSTRQQLDKDATYVECDERPRIDVFKESFFYRTYSEWNSLPPDIRSISDHVKFSLELKKHLWNAFSIPPSA